jgi:hypothetical protein
MLKVVFNAAVGEPESEPENDFGSNFFDLVAEKARKANLLKTVLP